MSRKHGGLIILHPDILVSSTKAADSSHCTRKAVLQELIRTVGDTTPSLIYGNMLHSLMQACMLENRWDDAFRQDKIAEIVKQSGGQLFAVNLEFEKAREELDERSKDLEAFADRYVGEEPKVSDLLCPFTNLLLRPTDSNSASSSTLFSRIRRQRTPIVVASPSLNRSPRRRTSGLRVPASRARST